MILSIKVTPRASQSKIQGVQGDQLKVSLNAPPAEGQANQELIRLLSKSLSIPKSRITIISGETSRSKRVLLSGTNPEELLNKLIL